MALQVMFTFPRWYMEDTLSVPAVSYAPDPIVLGNFMFVLATKSFYKCMDDTNPAALVWEKIPNMADIPTILSPVFSVPNFTSITTATQLSATRNAYVNYVFPTSMTSLVASQSLTATLQYADNVGMSTNLVTPNIDVNGCSGILSLTLSGRLQLSGMIPAGKYRRVVLSQTGGATVPTTISSSQEVLI